MPILAGTIAYAEGVSAAIAVYTAAGGGAAGWSAAAAFLRGRYSTALAASITSIISYAQQTVAIGAQYASGGPGFYPAYSGLPDLRPVERRAGIGPSGPQVVTTGTAVHHEVRIEVIDPTTGQPWYSVHDTIPAADVLTRAELEAAAQGRVANLLSALDTVPGATGRDSIDFQVRVRFRGAWIGYT